MDNFPENDKKQIIYTGREYVGAKSTTKNNSATKRIVFQPRSNTKLKNYWEKQRNHNKKEILCAWQEHENFNSLTLDNDDFYFNSCVDNDNTSAILHDSSSKKRKRSYHTFFFDFNIAKVDEERSLPVQSTLNSIIFLRKERNISECSDDSYIIFSHPEGETSHCNTFTDTSCSESTSFSSRDYHNDDDYTSAEDETTGNDKATIGTNYTSQKRVKFSIDNKVHLMVTWSFSYRQARISVWEQVARDNARFKCHIETISKAVSPILDQTHREKIYTERFKLN